MSVLSPAEIRSRVMKLWESQRLLRAWLAGESMFPIEWPTRLPKGRELVERYDEARRAIAALRAGERSELGYGYRLIDEELAHRQLGVQRLPVRAVLDSLDEALRLIGKSRDFARFVHLVEETRARQPALEDLLRARPLAILEQADAWPKLLRVCAYLREHPRPGCYLRELDLPGIDTKFLESQKGMLTEMLDRVLPPEAIDAQEKGVKAFERRFGFRHDPPGVRFRWLDPLLAPMGIRDMQIPLDEFSRLDPPAERIFITENKVNFLAFPELPKGLVIFGQGYAIQSLARIAWLSEKTLYYWGDIDTHGFEILSQLRAAHGNVRSLLMDEATLLAHRESWAREPEGARILVEPSSLTRAEGEVYRGLKEGRWGDCLRLEQERIAYGWLERALEDLSASG